MIPLPGQSAADGEAYNLVTQSLASYYDAEATRRDKGEIQGWKREERQRFLDALMVGRTAADHPTVLELGSGPGRDAQYFSDEYCCSVTCLDFSHEMVNKAKQRGLSAVKTDFSAGLDAASSNFDAVYAMNSLLHVLKRRLRPLIADMARVLKPDGIAYVGLYGGNDFEGHWQADPSGQARFFSYHTDEALQRLLVQDGHFEIMKFERIDTGGSRGGSTEHHFQSVILKRSAPRRSAPCANCHLDPEKVARWHTESNALLQRMDAMIEARVAARAQEAVVSNTFSDVMEGDVHSQP